MGTGSRKRRRILVFDGPRPVVARNAQPTVNMSNRRAGMLESAARAGDGTQNLPPESRLPESRTPPRHIPANSGTRVSRKAFRASPVTTECRTLARGGLVRRTLARDWKVASVLIDLREDGYRRKQAGERSASRWSLWPGGCRGDHHRFRCIGEDRRSGLGESLNLHRNDVEAWLRCAGAPSHGSSCFAR